jgi:uncharacterized membrane protein
MLDKISLSEREYENVAKGIAGGVGIGTLIGLIIGNVTLWFAIGGVVGIISSLIYSSFVKHKNKNS